MMLGGGGGGGGSQGGGMSMQMGGGGGGGSQGGGMDSGMANAFKQEGMMQSNSGLMGGGSGRIELSPTPLSLRLSCTNQARTKVITRQTNIYNVF